MARNPQVHPDFDSSTFERLVECAGAGVGRVWTGSSHTDLFGRRGHRHAQGVRRAVRTGPGSIVVRASERTPF
jgi:hypothetical protein